MDFLCQSLICNVGFQGLVTHMPLVILRLNVSKGDEETNHESSSCNVRPDFVVKSTWGVVKPQTLKLYNSCDVATHHRL
jgi:hypothetical protein